MPHAAAKLTWSDPRKARSRARMLRRASTDAERVLWSALRAHRLQGAHFRRQAPIGPYIVDFICHSAKFIVEIDGGQHYSDEGERNDTRRSAYLASRGFRTVRFSNLDVMSNRAGVLETIAAQVSSARLSIPIPPPQPSPASGGGSMPEQ